MRERSIRLSRKTGVLRQPIDASHVDKIPLQTHWKQRTKKELRQKLTAIALPLPSLLAHTKAHRHWVCRSCAWERIKKTHLPSLLAQTSTTPHTEAHRHRGRRSCAWSLETYRSRREPRSKGFFSSWFSLFPNLDFELLMGFSVFWVYGFFCFLIAFWLLYV